MNAPGAIGLPANAATAGFAAHPAFPEQTADSGGANGRPARVYVGRCLRALLLACLLGVCSAVFANDAQLILVSGDVTLKRAVAGGPTQSLVPVTGTRVQSGDALVTGAAGRVQLRFSDGSLVSLQPHSEFRIDEYRFDMNQQRGFFSLVRGALRTISGAVGKRDPDDYRMTTPTATIGIRGTEFLVEETVCTPACRPGRTAGLRVSVSAGRVVVSNAAGTIDVPAGNATYVAGPAIAPAPTSERPTMSTAPASFDPTGPGTVRVAGATTGPDSRVLAAPLNVDGMPPALLEQWRAGPLTLARADTGTAGPVTQAGSSIRSAPPKSTRSALPDSPGSPAIRQADAVAATAPGSTAPASTATPPTGPSAVPAADDDGPDPRETPDELAQVPSPGATTPIGGIDFNRPTAPAGTAGDGTATPASDPITTIALSPSGDGMLTAPLNGSSGSNAQLDPSTGAPIALGPGGNCRAIPCGPGAGGSGNAGGDGGTGSGSGVGGGDPDGNPGSGDPGGGNPGGGDPGGGDPGGGDPGGGDPGGGDPGDTPVLTPGLNEAGRIAVRTLQSPWFNLNLNAASAHVTLDSDYRLESIGLCPSVFCLARNTAQVAEAGHFSDVAWGRWVNGTARLTVLGLQTNQALGSNDGVHYLVGVPTVTMPTSGSANYAIAGATAPTFASGAVAPGVFTGQGLVQFGAGQATRVGFQGDMVFGSGERYHVFSNGARSDSAGRLVEIGDTQIRMTGRTTFSGNIGVVSQGSSDRLGCGGSHCQANVNGGFYGPEAARMGVGYSVGRTQGGGDTINGVAVLNRE